MAETEAKITVNGDISPLRQKLREASNDLKQFGAEGESAFSRMTGPLGALQAKFVAIGAILAGGAVFKDAVAQTVLFTEESTKLGRAMGISAGAASVLREALIAGNTSQEEFVTASKGLAKQLINNEDGLNAMGLKTRDAAGQLRPLNDLVLEGIEVLNGYKAGTDRAIAGQAMFGKGFEMTSNLANMNKQSVEEVAEQMRALGIVTSVESVAAWEAFDNAGDKASLTMKGFKVTIGNALMPVLTQLGEWFSSIGPAAITVLRGAVGGLVSLFWGLKTSASIAFNLINAAVVQVAEPIRAVSVAFWKMLQGDFEGAKSEIVNIPKVWSAAWSQSFDNILDSATEARDKMWNLFAEGTATAAPGTKGKSATGLLRDEKGGKAQKEAADPSFMATYEAKLAEIRNVYEQENLLRQFGKEQELAYWREIQQNLALTSKDRTTIAKRTATLEVEIRRQAAKEMRDLDSTLVDSRRAAGLAQIALETQQANFARENGEITKLQLIDLEEQFARRRFEIEYQSLLERMELAKSDPNSSPAALMQIKEQMLDVERNYQMRRGELTQGVILAERETWVSFTGEISSLWDKGINAMMNGTLTWRNAMRAVLTDMTAWFANEVVGKQVKEWIASQAKMLAAKMGFAQTEKAIQAATSDSIVAKKGAEVISVVAGNAAEAGSGAAASQASIPIVGPMLALAAMAAVFAAVMAMGSKKSAARGYDIPKGLNPMTQLHEEEMVLPQKYANVIRGLAGGGEGAVSPEPTSGDVHMHVHTQSPQDFARFLKANSHTLAPALRQLARNFTPVKGR
jgi:hypothetical protein